MVFEEVRREIGEILDIAEKCPEKYQVKCFEVLLNALVQRGYTPAFANVIPEAKKQVTTSKIDFFSQNSISEEEWSNVFYNDNNEWKIIVQDLKETTKSKKQIKLALLLGVKGLLENGDPYFSRGSLVALCEEHGTYDLANFSAYMRKQKLILLPKGNDGWILTQPGRKRAAEVIKELAQ